MSYDTSLKPTQALTSVCRLTFEVNPDQFSAVTQSRKLTCLQIDTCFMMSHKIKV